MVLEPRRMIDNIRAPQAMGRVKKTDNWPLDIIKEWRKARSSIGPRMNDNTSGASSYSNFLKIYPRTPKTIITKISKLLLLML